MGLLCHALQNAPDWQYGIVHWLALPDEPRLADKAPDGKGWVLNVDVGKRGHVVKTPAWSDGSIVMQLTYWRRPSPGMWHWHLRSVVQEDRRPWWRGSKIPEQILEEFGHLVATGDSDSPDNPER